MVDIEDYSITLNFQIAKLPRFLLKVFIYIYKYLLMNFMYVYIHVIFYIYYHTLCLCVRVCMCACLCVCICLICIWISYPIFVQNVPYTLKLNVCDRMSYFYNQSVANHSILNMYVYCSVFVNQRGLLKDVRRK